MTAARLLPLLVLAVSACGAKVNSPGSSPPASKPTTPPTTPPSGSTGMPMPNPMAMPPPPPPPVLPPSSIDWNSIDASAADGYLRKLALVVVGRVLNQAERQHIAAQGGLAIEPIIEAWTKEPGFVEAGRRFVEDSLSVSGKLGDIDFGLPGNLAAFLVKNNRPWSEIITSAECYDAGLRPMKCDSGAPYGAGVLTTRAILLSRSGRFNLTRASTLIRAFACQAYPLPEDLQKRADKQWLLPMFQALSPEEQVDDRAKNGFGNGFGCYTCHGQFSLHAQLFVKFDGSGLYRATANGLQDPAPGAELGRSATPGIMASHFTDPERASLEGIELFGTPVKNLGEATKVLAAKPLFSECAANKYLDHTLGVLSGHVTYDERMFMEIGYRARLRSPDPSLADIVYSLFTHPVVVRSFLASLNGGAP